MSAPRVPPGWTQAAADLVWEDWQAALDGGAPVLMPSPHHFHVLPGCEAACESLFGMCLCARSKSAPYGYRWTSPAARLRAWAAVGAPVLAPAEDGRPSLAEWVAAAEGSASGLLDSSNLNRLQWQGQGWAFGQRVRMCIVFHNDGPRGTVSVGDVATEVSTPAELRAALDELAVQP